MGEYDDLEKESSAGMLGGIFYLLVLVIFFETSKYLAIVHIISFPIFYWSSMTKILTFDFNEYWHSEGNFNRFLFSAIPTYAIVRKLYLEKKEEKLDTES